MQSNPDRILNGKAYIKITRSSIGSRAFSYSIYSQPPTSGVETRSILVPVEFEIPESAFEPPNPIVKLKMVKEQVPDEAIIINVEEVNR